MRRPAKVPPYDTRGLLAASVVIGAGLGILSNSCIRALYGQSDGATQIGGDWLNLAVFAAVSIVLFIVPAALIGCALAVLTPTRKFAFACGALCGVGFVLADSTIVMVRTFDTGIWTPAGVLSAWSFPLLGAILPGLMCLAAHQVVRGIVLRVFVGTPTMCWKCGYDVASDAAAVCSECGTPLDPSRFCLARVHAVARFLRRKAKLTGIVALIFLCGVVAVGATAAIGSPGRAFRSRFATYRLSSGAVYSGTNWPNGPLASGVSALVPIEGTSYLVIVSYLPRDRSGFPAMQLQLGRTVSGQRGWNSMPVFCNLDRTQAEWVVSHGLPKSLIDAIAAQDSRWSAAASSPPPVFVDPAEHLGGK